MSNLVIVALPSEEDYVNKISSEKVAHMTLLFLGETTQVQNLAQIIAFVQHAANQSLLRFSLEVDHRGVLGIDEADVLFFSKTKWSGYEEVNAYRSFLLKDDNIRKAYDSTTQFDEWNPHLTLGYPESPAHPDERDYPGLGYVGFDRIAVWFGDYEGIEIPLNQYEYDMEVSMDSVTPNAKDMVENILTHHGVLGMRWGVRRGSGTPVAATVAPKGRKKLKGSGGENHPATKDAIAARTLGQKAKKSGYQSLSNKELQDYTQRLNLEANARRVDYAEKSKTKKFIADTLTNTGKSSLTTATNQVAAQEIKKHMIKSGILKVAGAAAVAA
jgi:2'-5' RNA ligase